MKRKAVFVDRDGTVIAEGHYLSDPEQVVLINGAAEALRRLSKSGFQIVMVTNQSGVARGMFPEDAVHRVNQRVRQLLRLQGAELDAIYYCPHHPEGIVQEYAVSCTCRKPLPGMGQRAAAELGLDLGQCYMIGDKPEDVLFGRNCGMRQAFLVSTGHGRNARLPENFGAMAPDILAAAKIILKDGG